MQDKSLFKATDLTQQIPESARGSVVEDLLSSLIASGRQDEVLRILSKFTEKGDAIANMPGSLVSPDPSQMEELRMPRFFPGGLVRPPLIR